MPPLPRPTSLFPTPDATLLPMPQEVEPESPSTITDHPETAFEPSQDPLEFPGSVTTLTVEQLRREGVLTLGEALQDVIGLDAAEGSDRGPWLSSLGLRGVDQLGLFLITIDGVPAGGALEPALTQIALTDVESIEVVRGPVPVIDGMQAMAGAIHVVTRTRQDHKLEARFGGDTFAGFHGAASWTRRLGENSDLRIAAHGRRTEASQDRTQLTQAGISAALGYRLGEGGVKLYLQGFQHQQDWGAPIPYAGDQPFEGFGPDTNYAVGGAVEEHQVFAASLGLAYPLNDVFQLGTTLGFATDKRTAIRSFVSQLRGDDVFEDGLALEPKETTFFADLNVKSSLELLGSHGLTVGVSANSGKIDGDGEVFAFRFQRTEAPQIPDVDTLADGPRTQFEEKRLFFGAYLHDQWTVHPRVTLSGGIRFNTTSDKLAITRDQTTESEKEYQGLTSEGAVLVRLFDKGAGALNDVAFYATARHNFHPPVANIAALSEARIFEPEWIDNQEIGLKTLWLDRRMGVDLGIHHTRIENRPVPALGIGGVLRYESEGELDVVGSDLEFYWTPLFLEGLAFRAGYAYQKPELRKGSFVTADGLTVDVSGQRPGLIPQSLWNVKILYAPEKGLGGFVAARGQDKRPLDPTETATTPSYAEVDAGISYGISWGRLSVVGRNLSDERFITTGSDLAIGQFYFAPARRIAAELSLQF